MNAATRQSKSRAIRATTWPTAGGARLGLLGGSRTRPWELVFWFLPWLVVAIAPSLAFLVNQMAIMALFAISLDLILGFAGIMSLGHAAFFGIGAFAAGLFSKFFFSEPITGLLLATALSGIAAFLCSFMILRGTPLTILMVTLGVSMILYELGNNMAGLTGGADGLQDINIGPVLGLFPFKFDGLTAAYYSLAVLLACILICRRIVNSPFGARLEAIRDNRLRASAIGINADGALVRAYTLAGALAGTAGAAQAQCMNFASLDVFAFDRSADALLMVVIGAPGWLYGGVVGAVVFSGLHQFLSDLTPQYWTFFIGMFLIVLTRVGRARLMRPRAWFKRTHHG